MERTAWYADSSPAIIEELSAAAQAYGDTAQAEERLKAAMAQDESCLGVYFAMYKFYFYKHRLEDAERTALMGLAAAAALGGFSSDWRQLAAESADWSKADSASHFFLFTLKALAFIRLRLGRSDESLEILGKLRELDPADSVGASVIADIAAGSGAVARL